MLIIKWIAFILVILNSILSFMQIIIKEKTRDRVCSLITTILNVLIIIALYDGIFKV